MTKASFKASRIVIKDIPKDRLVSTDEMKMIRGGMSYRPDFLSEEWLILTQGSSGTGIKPPSMIGSNMSSCATHTT